MKKSGPILTIFLAVCLYVWAHTGDTPAPLGALAAFAIAVGGLVWARYKYGQGVGRLIQGAALAGVWGLLLYLANQGAQPFAALYLELVVAAGASVAYSQGSMDLNSRRWAYGAVLGAVALPALLSLLSIDSFLHIFRSGAQKPFQIATIFGFGLYTAAFWLKTPKTPTKPEDPAPVDSVA